MTLKNMLQSIVPNKIDIGWGLDTEEADFVFYNPEPLFSSRQKPLSSLAVQACPAVNNLEKDFWVISSPFSIELKCVEENGTFELLSGGENTRVDLNVLQNSVALEPKTKWRHDKKPIVQIYLPYFFLSDKPCYMSVIAPFCSDNICRWPGVFVGGKIPIHIWPRTLNFAFEWVDTSKPLVIKRGDPLMYVFFSTNSLCSRPNVFELEMTEELKKYKKGIKNVLKYTSSAYSLFPTALSRRPKKLLKRK